MISSSPCSRTMACPLLFSPFSSTAMLGSMSELRGKGATHRFSLFRMACAKVVFFHQFCSQSVWMSLSRHLKWLNTGVLLDTISSELYHVDDLTLFVPSAHAQMLEICKDFSAIYDIQFNSKKTVCTCFLKCKVKFFARITFNDEIFRWQSGVKYLESYAQSNLKGSCELIYQKKELISSANSLIACFNLLSHDGESVTIQYVLLYVSWVAGLGFLISWTIAWACLVQVCQSSAKHPLQDQKPLDSYPAQSDWIAEWTAQPLHENN